VFGAASEGPDLQPVVKELHAKIGQLAMENECVATHSFSNAVHIVMRCV
jgi:hypothetical protein